MVSRISSLFGRGRKDVDCDEVLRLGSDYVDDDMDAQKSEQVRGHLAWCAPCNAFINTLKATVDMLRSTPRQEPPSGFRDRVRASLHDRNEP